MGIKDSNAAPQQPLIALRKIDLMDNGYRTVFDLPDMVETVFDSGTQGFLKLGLLWDARSATFFPFGSAIREDMQKAIAERVQTVLPEEYAKRTGKDGISVGDAVALNIAKRLYQRMSVPRSASIGVDTPGDAWIAHVQIKPGVTIKFSPNQHHRSMPSGKGSMSGYVSNFAEEKVYWVLRTEVGDVTNYFTDEHISEVWDNVVVMAFPFIPQAERALLHVFRG